jgi:uncharacterized protein (DUF2252 family)
MNIREATRAYEKWLEGKTAIVRADLRLKHARMALSPFVFLRGTFYRWLQLWPAVCPDLVDAPVVLAVGDLHIENFGTWRDIEGRLIWGLNDVDETCRLPYTNDLVRLATSALLAVREHHLALTPRESCAAILEGYQSALECGGRPIVLAERRRWLRQIALNDLRDPLTFWAKLTSQRPATGPLPHKALRLLLPESRVPYRVVRRVAGMGSLGRPRFVALAEWRGAMIAREAKALIPSAAEWVDHQTSSRWEGLLLLRQAVRMPDPFYTASDKWIVRRLAPDCSRIEVAELPKKRAEAKLLRAMGWETANIHLGTRRVRLAVDVGARRTRWLERAATEMADAVMQDWRDWARALRAGA